MNHGSLFSGIGGFDLAAQWMNWQNKFHCENNSFGKHILNHYWPNAQHYDDIKTANFNVWKGRIDVLSGGFPCQPYSAAGKRKGTDDERHLWPFMLDAIDAIEPRWIVGENVFGLITRNAGLVFDEIQIDLEIRGYKVQPFVLPACGVDAPHRRDRVWFVAYADKCDDGRNTGTKARKGGKRRLQEWDEIWQSFKSSEIFNLASNTDNPRTNKRVRSNGKRAAEGEERKRKPEFESWKAGEHGVASNTDGIGRGTEDDRERQGTKVSFANCETNPWENFPIESPVCDGNDGVSTGLDGITFPKWRNESIMAGGNAVVPQVVLQIFKAIELFERMNV